MTMTHYMELLATNQPWNLIIFMAIPVVLAEMLAITELYILLNEKTPKFVKKLNDYSGITAGIYFGGITLYLILTVVIPLTLSSSWRGIFDVIAVLSYLLGSVPLLGIALLKLSLIKKHASHEEKRRTQVFFVAFFLVVAHIAMIFGMLNPDLLKSNPHEGMEQMIME